MGGDGWVEGGGPQGGHYPPSPSLSIPWGRNILDVQGRPPLAEGQRGFPLERREIVGSLGKEKAGSTWGVCSLLSLHWEWPVTAFRYGRIHHYDWTLSLLIKEWLKLCYPSSSQPFSACLQK